MAFRQPAYHAPPRTFTQETNSQPLSQTQHNIQERARESEEGQEWILFTPVAPSFTEGTCTISTGRTRRTRTAGHSRLSDFGSLETAARSYGIYDDHDYDIDEDGDAQTGDDNEDAELDSLDSHLHEFRTEPSVFGNREDEEGPVLPKHDGLGSFRIDGIGEEVRQHLYAFEMYNPRRVKRRRESLEIGERALDGERAAEMERTRRIEMWRMEQSRALVDEIQRETRRRKQSMSSGSERRSTVEDKEQEDVATFNHVEVEPSLKTTSENDNLWSRLTRRVIRDLMGIDNDLLSIIFGKSLPTEDDLSKTPGRTTNIPTATTQRDQSSWECRLLERIARELGLLVNQLSDHPGAFSTYLQTQQTPLPYAGLPVIPESTSSTNLNMATHISRADLEREESQDPLTSTLNTSADVEFHPTITRPVSIPNPSQAGQEWELEDDSTPRPSFTSTITREEWERDLDISMVFRYLKNRFLSRSENTHGAMSMSMSMSMSGSRSALAQGARENLAVEHTPDSLARVARVRAHHPLVNLKASNAGVRRRVVGRRGSSESGAGLGKGGLPMGGGSTGIPIGGTLKSLRIGSGSSRHYWDIGGSLAGSSTRGSVVVGGAGGGGIGIGIGIGIGMGMGAWGEV
ncbi:hypothetical protein DSL72_000618 [Monilinia vaccinii-corymbosi]|uniref:Uncharacterized protein n=1 Tax=Monilinia vaccinii-corymbosi TaxID=61207 RepID=A0A8A3PAD4_9HELO|nr:hypothetical protein DSL72_000618 [Monilinia vaccinii-corymbosi]